MKLDKQPTSILLPEGISDVLDKLAAQLTLKHDKRFTRADAHRHALMLGIDQARATFDGPTSEINK